HRFDRFAGAIDSAICIDEGLQKPSGWTTGDASIGEIEGSAVQIQNGKVTARAIGGDQRWRSGAVASQQSRGKEGLSRGIGDSLTELILTLRQQANRCSRDRLRRPQ